jgi:hypothetical protein
MAALFALPIFVIVLLCAGLFIIHFLPAFIAFHRKAENFIWILLINIFFGWTLIGWLVALIWATQDRPRHGTY